MDDFVSWQTGTLQLGMYRDGPRREMQVYACEFLPGGTGHKPLHHLKAQTTHVIDCFGNLVPVPAWRRQPEDIEA